MKSWRIRMSVTLNQKKNTQLVPTSRYYMGNKIIINYWLLNGSHLYCITFIALPNT